MMYILYEYMRKQRPTFSSVRKVTLNGCYGINTNDNNNGVYPLLPFVYTYIRPLHHVNPDHRFPLLFILFLLPSEPFPSTFITVLLYIHFLYYIQALYTIIISSPFLPIQLAAVRPNVYFGLEVNIYCRPDEYIRYIIIISPPSTCTNTRVYSPDSRILQPHPQITLKPWPFVRLNCRWLLVDDLHGI